MDIKILNQDVYNRIKAEGSLDLANLKYMEGWWECKALDQFFYKLFLAKIPDNIGFSLPLLFSFLSARFFNLQSKIAHLG